MKRHDKDGLPSKEAVMADDAVLDVSSELEGGFPCGRFLMDEEASVPQRDTAKARPEMC